MNRSVYWIYRVRSKDLSEKGIREAMKDAVKRGADIISIASYRVKYDFGGAPEEEFALFNPSSILPIHEEAKDVDLLKLQVDIAHEEGLKTQTYINAHWYGVKYYNEHKDYVQIKSDGSPVDNLYGHGYSMCVNTGYRDRMFKIITDVAARGVDIVFLDGPAYYPGACYCDACRRKFYELYGMDMPTEEDWKNPAWRRFVQFRYRSIRDFLVDAQKAIREAGYKSMLYSNTSGQTWPVWQFALSMEDLWEGESILAAESYQYYRSTLGIPVWLYGWTAKYGNSVKQGKLFRLALSRAHEPWIFYNIPRAERRISVFQGIANGANLLEYNKESTDLIMLTKKWRRYLTDLISAAKVAMVWSRKTADYMYDEPGAMLGEVSFEAQAVQVQAAKPPSNIKAETIERYVHEVRGFYEMLIRLHVPFDLLGGVNITKENLSKYDVLILPSTSSLSEEQASAIREFVKAGGGLIASYKVGVQNELGDPYNDTILSDVLNVRYTGKIMGPLPWDYLRIKKEHTVMDGLPIHAEESGTLPSPEYNLKVEPSDEAEVLAVQIKHIASRYAKPSEEGPPAIIASKYGDGRILYFSGTFGGQYWSHGFLDYLKLMENAVKWVNPNSPVIETDAPETIEVTMHKGESWSLIFLANYNFAVRRPFNEIYPASNVKLKVRVESTPSKVMSLISEKPLKFKEADDGIEIYLPSIGEFEIVLLED